MKNTKILITGLICISIVAMIITIVNGSRSQAKPKQIITSSPIPQVIQSSPIFFYGNTCPHCKDVEEWMTKNKIEEKMQIVKKEVYDNRANSLELADAAKSCGLPTDSIGVPFLFAEGKCLIGTPEITKYLSDKTEVKDQQ
jgi:glutaredoxin